MCRSIPSGQNLIRPTNLSAVIVGGSDGRTAASFPDVVGIRKLEELSTLLI